MIIFKFSTEDLTDREKEFYHDVELRFAFAGYDLCDMVTYFKQFMIAMTYNSGIVNKIVYCDDECQVREGQEI